MVIAGIDPSLANCGIVVLKSGDKTTLIYKDTLSTPVALTTQERAAILGRKVHDLLVSLGVDKVAIETQYMGRANPSSVIKLAMAAGAICGVCGVLKIEVVGVSPLKAKQVVEANDKKGVADAVKRWLWLKRPLNEHESAAAAIAAAALSPTLSLSLDQQD